MILSAELAQQIIDKTQDILDANINVMDARGVIIASGDAARLGTLHDGAVLALKRGNALEIGDADVAAFKGARPGINLLLECAGKTVGVLGITGQPERVRQSARLVKVAAEMLVEQADMLARLEWAKRHREGFILSWINNELAPDQLLDWAERLGIDVRVPRVAVLIELDRASPTSRLTDMQRLMELLATPQRDNLVSLVSSHRILVLKPLSSKPVSGRSSTGQCSRGECSRDESLRGESSRGESSTEQPRPMMNRGRGRASGGAEGMADEQRRINDLLERLRGHGIDDVRVAVGRAFDAPKDLHLSVESAQQVLQVGKQHYPQRTTYYYDDLHLPVLLSPLADGWQGHELRSAIDLIHQNDSGGRLLKTLNSLIKHQGNLSRCADALHIHRNTLRYRLDRIHDITGISPHRFTGLVELYLGLQLSIDDG